MLAYVVSLLTQAKEGISNMALSIPVTIFITVGIIVLIGILFFAFKKN